MYSNFSLTLSCAFLQILNSPKVQVFTHNISQEKIIDRLVIMTAKCATSANRWVVFFPSVIARNCTKDEGRPLEADLQE